MERSPGPERLTGLDAAFLALETPHSTGHVGGLSILDPATAAEPLDLSRLTELYAARLPLVPVLRRRLVSLPLGLDQPFWVDDPHFDLTFHLREVALPEPGSDAQLAEQVSRLHARPLDQSRPLWETYLISGLRDDRVGLYLKVHHAALDGVSGNEVLSVLTDLDPAGRTLPEPDPWDPPPLPSTVRLGWRATKDLVRRPLGAARIATDVARSLPGLLPAVGLRRPGQPAADSAGEGSEDGGVIDTGAGLAPPTPLNTTITPHRRFGFVSLPLEEVKQVKNAFGVSVNDVVMALCAGVLRTWLLARDALPEQPLVAMVPVSIRAGRESGDAPAPELGNQVSAMLAQLPTHLADPVARLRAAHRATRRAKAQQAFLPQGLVEDLTDFAPPALTTRAFRTVFDLHLRNRVPVFNVVISNIPGSPVPFYLAGAKLLSYYPVSVVTDGLALNITVISYLGQMHFGLVADRSAVPDLDAVTAGLVDELAALLDLAAAP